MIFLIYCFGITKALWGEIVLVTSANASFIGSVVIATVEPSSTKLYLLIAASKMVRLSPLGTALIMAILSVGLVMLFWVHTSMISF